MVDKTDLSVMLMKRDDFIKEVRRIEKLSIYKSPKMVNVMTAVTLSADIRDQILLGLLNKTHFLYMLQKHEFIFVLHLINNDCSIIDTNKYIMDKLKIGACTINKMVLRLKDLQIIDTINMGRNRVIVLDTRFIKKIL